MGKIQIKVVPSSSKDAVVGWLGKSLKVKVQAPPEKGKANAAVIELLANYLEIDKSQLEITSGHTSSTKVLLIYGWQDEQIASALRKD